MRADGDDRQAFARGGTGVCRKMAQRVEQHVEVGVAQRDSHEIVGHFDVQDDEVAALGEPACFRALRADLAADEDQCRRHVGCGHRKAAIDVVERYDVAADQLHVHAPADRDGDAFGFDVRFRRGDEDVDQRHVGELLRKPPDVSSRRSTAANRHGDSKTIWFPPCREPDRRSRSRGSNGPGRRVQYLAVIKSATVHGPVSTYSESLI